MNRYLEGLASILAIVLIWAGSIALIGVAFRFMKELFCFGYGC